MPVLDRPVVAHLREPEITQVLPDVLVDVLVEINAVGLGSGECRQRETQRRRAKDRQQRHVALARGAPEAGSGCRERCDEGPDNRFDVPELKRFQRFAQVGGRPGGQPEPQAADRREPRKSQEQPLRRATTCGRSQREGVLRGDPSDAGCAAGRGFRPRPSRPRIKLATYLGAARHTRICDVPNRRQYSWVGTSAMR